MMLVLLLAVAVAVAVVERAALPAYVLDDTEALARVIRSEVGQSSLQHRVHVAWATRNLADERRQSIARMVCAPCGPQTLGRPVSSRQAPTDSDRLLAKHILASPRMIDPTGGATQFIDPKLQDQLAARGAPGYHGRTYRRVRRQWATAYGWEPYYRLGPDLELWGRTRRARVPR